MEIAIQLNYQGDTKLSHNINVYGHRGRHDLRYLHYLHHLYFLLEPKEPREEEFTSLPEELELEHQLREQGSRWLLLLPE